MDRPAASRPRRSRLGCGLLVLFAVLGTWEALGRTTTIVPPCPSLWACALLGRGTPPGAPSEADLEKSAYRPLPYVNYGLKPSFVRASPDGRQRSSNRLGFRGPEVELPKPPGRYRIVCLGGSTTYSDAVSDDETYPVHLERMLREALPGRDIEVVNAGVPSYTTAESLANLAFICLDLSPDMLVVYHAVNDYRPRVYRTFDPAYFHFRKVWSGGASGWVTGEGDMASGINALIQHDLPPDNGSKAENAARAGTWAYRRNLTSIAGIAAAHGIRIAFVTMACDAKNRYTPAEMVAAIDEHNQVMRAVAARQGAIFIDMAAEFPTQGVFHDPVHLNAQGTRVKARLIANGLLGRL